jgi:diketogulonate reductase-like aldo/keto reductase
MGEKPGARAAEVAALRRGLDLGMTLIDTAEMYADGGAEEVVGEAVSGRRDEVFLVSKVLPGNASRKGAVRACEASLQRLGTDRIDLYLLHWRGTVPFSETLEAFHALVRDGKIRNWGISNLDVEDLEEWTSLPGGEGFAANQVLYNLARRGIEFDLLPWSRGHSVATMAYSPIEQGRLLGHPTLRSIAGRHGAAEAQIALAWVMRHPDVIAIPKASRLPHVEENRAALDIVLSPEDLVALDEAFPPPRRKRALEML